MIRDLQFAIRSRFEEIQIVFDGISILFAISSLSFYGIILCTYIYIYIYMYTNEHNWLTRAL